MQTLRDLAALGDALAATPSKLAKAQLIAQHLRTAAECHTLGLVARYLTGRVFPATDPRTPGARSATVRDAVVRATALTPTEWRRCTLAAGAIGEALASIHSRFPPAAAPAPLTLAELDHAFGELATTTSPHAKRDRLAALLLRSAADGPRALAYVGKILGGDLRIGVAEGVLLDGIAAAFGVSTDAVRAGLRSLGDVADVAACAASGGEAALRSAPFTLFRPIAFMLAAVATDPADLANRLTEPALLEDKLDGIRVQAHVAHGRVELFTRTLDRVTESFPDVAKLLGRLPGELLLDGEVVAVHPPEPGGNHPSGIAPFARLQNRLNRRKLSPAVLAAFPAGFIPFDLLYCNGEVLLDRPLAERRARLEAALNGSSVFPLAAERVDPPADAAVLAARFADARKRRNEGLVLKLLSSPYTPGRRGGVWFKLKSHLPTLDCVVVQAEVGHGKRRSVLSDYTFAVRATDAPDSPLLTLGKAYSGLTDSEIARLTQHFRETATASDGRRVTVRPTLVLEIAFDAIQLSHRHDSGFALRFPRIARIRTDKHPSQASTLAEVRAIFESPDNLNRNQTDPPQPAGPTHADRSGQLSLFD